MGKLESFSKNPYLLGKNRRLATKSASTQFIQDMASSQVFFTNLRTTPTSNLLDKMERLVRRAGIAGIDFENRFAAIKIHFGEPGNMAYLRPQYAARMAGLLRSLGAKPFLTDANTLYSGRRANAVDHLQSAMENGYNPISAQCQVIIADGLKGIDYREIEIDGEYCKAPKIGAAVADADIVISMTHFKGHEQTGFGGTLKNLGMGCARRRRQAGTALRGPARRQNGKLPRLQHLRKTLRARRHTPEPGTESRDRLLEVRRLRTMHRVMPVRQRVDGGQRYLGTPELQNRRIHEGRAERQAELPCQLHHERLAGMRLLES